MGKWSIGEVCGLRMIEGKGAIVITYDGMGIFSVNASTMLNKKTGDDAERDTLSQKICDALNAAGITPSDAYMSQGR